MLWLLKLTTYIDFLRKRQGNERHRQLLHETMGEAVLANCNMDGKWVQEDEAAFCTTTEAKWVRFHPPPYIDLSFLSLQTACMSFYLELDGAAIVCSLYCCIWSQREADATLRPALS